jgi:hypothetical protein
VADLEVAPPAAALPQAQGVGRVQVAERVQIPEQPSRWERAWLSLQQRLEVPALPRTGRQARQAPPGELAPRRAEHRSARRLGQA